MTEKSREIIKREYLPDGVGHVEHVVDERSNRYEVRVKHSAAGIHLGVGLNPEGKGDDLFFKLFRGTWQILSPEEARHIANLLIAASEAVTP